MPVDQTPILFASPEKIDPLADAEMVPVFLVPIAAAEQGYFLKRLDQRPTGAKGMKDIGIGLPFEITDKIAENKTEIDQHQ